MTPRWPAAWTEMSVSLDFPITSPHKSQSNVLSTNSLRLIKCIHVPDKKIRYTSLGRCNYIMQVSSRFLVVKKEKSRNHLLRGYSATPPPQPLVTRKPATVLAVSRSGLVLLFLTTKVETNLPICSNSALWKSNDFDLHCIWNSRVSGCPNVLGYPVHDAGAVCGYETVFESSDRSVPKIPKFIVSKQYGTMIFC